MAKSSSFGKGDLVEAVAKSAKLEKKQAKAAIDSLVETVVSTLKKGGKIQLTGFGTFSVSPRKKRTGINPRTGEKISIPARKVPKFTAGKALKSQIK
jgi:nucleoid DNA-binding protein